MGFVSCVKEGKFMFKVNYGIVKYIDRLHILLKYIWNISQDKLYVKS